MGFKCGIVGLPNVGKSTLFNALTQAKIEAQNYPFCTIDPNVGMVTVPDPRLDTLSNIINPQKTIPTTMQFVDIAGLVKGAASGEGLGNQFLANIRETDAIAHVVRCFENDDIVHVEGKIDPLSDIEVIHTELALADLESVEKALLKVSKIAKSGDKDALFQQIILERIKQCLDQGDAVRTLEFDENEKAYVKRLNLLTIKPTLYIANISEDGNQDNPYLDQVRALADKEGAMLVPISCHIESELVELDDEEKAVFLEDLGLEEPGLNRVIRAGYALLNLHTYFTAGPKEVRAWTVKKGASAPEAAGVIHTDFQKGFIRAEVTAFDDYVQYNGEQGAKDAGKLRLEGKDYIVHDGDVMHFRFNV